MCPKNNIQYLVLTGTVIMIYSKKYMLALWLYLAQSAKTLGISCDKSDKGIFVNFHFWKPLGNPGMDDESHCNFQSQPHDLRRKTSDWRLINCVVANDLIRHDCSEASIRTQRDRVGGSLLADEDMGVLGEEGLGVPRPSSMPCSTHLFLRLFLSHILKSGNRQVFLPVRWKT